MTVRSERAQGLGRGLSALIPQRAAGMPGPTEIAIARIRPNPNQPRRRFDDVEMATLTASIREHGAAQVSPCLGRDVGGQVRSGVGHRQHDALELESGVEMVSHEIDGGQQLGQTLKRVVLALERDKDRICGGQGIHGQEPE